MGLESYCNPLHNLVWTFISIYSILLILLLWNLISKETGEKGEQKVETRKKMKRAPLLISWMSYDG